MIKLFGMRSMLRLTIMAILLAGMVLTPNRALPGSNTATRPEARTGRPVGTDDGHIQVIPAPSSLSVKNGGNLKIPAVDHSLSFSNPAWRGSVKLGNEVTTASGWHDAGQRLTLRAVPAAACRFAFWYGRLGGRTNPAGLTITQPASILARFDRSDNGVLDWNLYGE